MVTLGLVVAEFEAHAGVIDEMEARAREAAADRDADVEALRVPGSYDAPLAADRLARREDVDAVAVVGAVISGDTDHDRVIADAAATGLTRVSLDRDLPVTLGVTGPGMSADEARARTHRAAEAASGALEMVGIGFEDGDGPAGGGDARTDGGEAVRTDGGRHVGATEVSA